MTADKPRLILIAGPTAAGKSALAADLAVAAAGAVINADAMQVYRGLPILTAQPDAATKERALHLLYEIADPAEAYSAGKWLGQAKAAVRESWKNGQTPVLVGGTGMYFQSLLKGLADIPDIPPHLRAALHAEYQSEGEAAMRARLNQYDPASTTTIRPGDQQRLLRALEIVLATGKTQTAWQAEMPKGLLSEADIFPIVLLPPREELYTACDQRFTAMLWHGAIDEAKTVLSRQLPATLPALKIIGLREIKDYADGVCTLAEATAKAQQATRNYAKRQVTWFKNQWGGNKIGFTRPALLLEKFYEAADLAIFERYIWN